MSKKLIFVLSAISLLLYIFTLTACGGIVGNKWKHDGTYHWHEQDGEITDKAEHVAGEWITEKEPTAVENGLKKKVCKVCGATVETIEILANIFNEEYTGSGTWEDPYLIRNRTELHYVRQRDGKDVYFKLVNDIDLAGTTFQPFEDFYGNFDGGGNCLYNFSISSGNYAEIGLFRKNHGTVANLKLSSCGDDKLYIGVIPDRQTVSCGALIGDNFGNVYNCSVQNAEVRVNSSFKTGEDGSTTINVGGLIGKVSGGDVKGCYTINSIIYGYAKNDSNIYSPFSAVVYAGGLIGSSYSSVSHCYAYGNSIEANAYAYYYSANVVGYYSGSVYEQLGGVVGYLNNSTATALIGYENKFKATWKCDTGGKMYHKGSLSYNFGEAIGYNSGTLQYVYGKTSDSVSVAGVAGTNYYCEQIDMPTFTNIPIFNGEGIWTLDVKTVEIENEKTGETSLEEVYNVAFKDDYIYKFDKPAETVEESSEEVDE